MINQKVRRKVLVTATTFPRWENDHVPYFVYDLTQQYLLNGLDVVVLAPHYPGAKLLENLNGIKVYRFPYFLPFKYQKICYDGGILGNLEKSTLAKIEIPFFLLSALLSMIWLVKKEKVEVIHSHWIISQGFVASIVSFLTGVKHINTIHAGDLALLEKVPLRKRIARFIYHNSANILIVSSHGVKRFNTILEESGEQKLRVLPMGVDLKLYIPQINKSFLKRDYAINEKNVLLFIGRLSEKKGLQFLIRAMPDIVEEIPDTKLIIVGDGPERNFLSELSQKLQLDQHILFKGFLTGQEKVDFLHIADILVIPSIETEDGDVEGLPVVLLEGMASKKKIVATDTGGISDLLIHNYNGLLIDQRSPDSIRSAVIQLLKDPQQTDFLTANAFKSVREYDWKNIGLKYSQVINII